MVQLGSTRIDFFILSIFIILFRCETSIPVEVDLYFPILKLIACQTGLAVQSYFYLPFLIQVFI